MCTTAVVVAVVVVVVVVAKQYDINRRSLCTWVNNSQSYKSNLEVVRRGRRGRRGRRLITNLLRFLFLCLANTRYDISYTTTINSSMDVLLNFTTFLWVIRFSSGRTPANIEMA